MAAQLKIAGIIRESIVDGPGIRFVVFTQGCSHRCPGCHNPQTHDPEDGNWISTDKLLEEIGKNPMLKGVTFSGGDPIVQAEFVARVSRRLRDSGVHTAAETSLCGSAEEAVLLAENTDLMIVDLKLADSALHERYTGMPNGMILDNIRLLKERGTCILFRTPLIPGITDGAENLRALAEIAGGHPWEKLAYNRLAGAKYAMLGRKFDEKGEIGAI